MPVGMSVEPGSINCAGCAASVPADARFCMACGRPTAVDDGDSKRQERLASTAPPPLVAKMRAARLAGERKPVTALFADVVGSTTLAERLDPEDWTQIINETFELMSQAVFRYEGTIAQLQGDAMLAFFGAPVAHEDDPERAVLAALDMVDAMAEFAAQLDAAQGIAFAIRVGINTGPVVVGQVGSDLRYEYTALGDAMNVAARMQAAAEPGTVLITDATRRLLADAFELDDVGEITVKGKADPVHAHRVVGRRADPGPRRGLARIGLESPMVGRDGQLKALRELLPVVAAGRGRMALVMGEPGIGKSRLLAELKATIETERDQLGDFRWIEARSVSYGQSLPYHHLIELVGAALELSPAETGDRTRAQLDERLADILGRQATDASPFLAHLLSLPLSEREADLTRVDPVHLQERYAGAVLQVLRALASRSPVVLICEDLHWADSASIQVVNEVLPLTKQIALLLVCSMRLETETPGWKLVDSGRRTFGEALTDLRLEPLGQDDSRNLVANLLAIESLPDSVRDLIMARAEGNPFFVEEVVRMLIERGLIERRDGRWLASADVQTVDIPETLHGLLLARIDQLPDSAKRSLRVAAVIGRQFPVRVLERVLGASVADAR
jgi:class 3 adenylate cyclase